ncbi:MAG: hypothetical protein EPN89_02005 [Methylovulum sp.]|nr:MAG: hypothetical protein EPN89_02005 [Methylovulum sp.]
MSHLEGESPKPRHKEKPIIVDRYVSGMGMALAMKGIGSNSTVHEKGGAVYVDANVREKAIEILEQLGFVIVEG